MSELFEIVEGDRHASTTLLRVRGRLDAKSAPLLLEAASAVRAMNRNLILDLSGVNFMASSGLGSLLSLTEEFRQSPVSVRIVKPSSAVESVIRLLNLDQFLSIDDSVAEALHVLEA